MSALSAPVLTTSRLSALFALAAVVFGTCWLAAQSFEGVAGVTAFWPANALVLAFILRACRTRQHSALALAVAYAAMVAANLAVGRTPVIALSFPLANIVEIMVAAWFMRRIVMPLCGLRDLGQFLAGAVLAGPLASTLIAALIMATNLGLSGVDLVRQAGSWLLADVMGMAIVAPFALSLGVADRGRWLRALAVPASIGLICFLLCWQRQLPVMFLAFPMVVVAVLRDRDRGGALAVGAVAIGIIGAAVLGQGPIALLPRFGVDPGILMPVFFGALVLTVYPLAAVLRELDVLAGELERRRAAAETDSAAKSVLIGRVGEELRSPLTGVVTVAEMLRSGRLGELNERQRDLLTRVAESGAEIENLSREMVALADGGQMSSRTAGVADVVTEAIAAARFRARRALVSLQALPGEAHWRADFDADRLKRLVHDGLSAALDAAPVGSTVRVVAGLQSDGRFILTVEDAGELSLAERQTRFASALAMPPAEDGLAFDRAELRKHGGDLSFGPGALGGGKLTLLLPRVADAGAVRAA